jgi:hypothetical protein
MRAFLCASLLALLECHSTPEPRVGIQFHAVPGSLDHVMAGAPPARALAVTLMVGDED